MILTVSVFAFQRVRSAHLTPHRHRRSLPWLSLQPEALRKASRSAAFAETLFLQQVLPQEFMNQGETAVASPPILESQT